ncbi:TIGR04283 family arsenosugar biosynthesis glycosyltransferase [uncultured Planktosalinus sp.]|uniref:TIGR04283 family arsenosugar biosynthesis glycosyltransferase n=1 Tax=uncultured Planktosalinus sp. TaxID=1810935 RepID=UPI0030DC9CC1|tara:strand:+ start:32 stop:724 length:693 start_codon:yes stop_codon:yes gene_type:complete
MTLSIIIPVLNEEENLKVLLPYLKNNASGPLEIIVADGGSTDASVAVAINNNSKVIQTKKGRAKQMNAGAKVASNAILYFLHADTIPPKSFDTLILNAIKKNHKAGCFRMRFDSNHWWLRLAGWFTRFNVKYFRGGDQSLFVTKTLFEEIGGYDEKYIIYEDNVLIAELYRRTTFTVLSKPVSSSARRYLKKGIWRLQFHFWRIHFMKLFGAKPDKLYQYYKTKIATNSN